MQWIHFTLLKNTISDVIVSITYFSDGYIGYAFVTLCFVFIPTVIVQIFSIRWHQRDNMITQAIWAAHAVLMGVVQRYLVVLKFGKEAMRTRDEIDYQRFYQQQSDVVMLRLFDSFGESAPQLVFHLYVMIVEYFAKPKWSTVYASWTGMSAMSSVISLGTLIS